MIYVITGTPGAGKTLRAVELLLDWKKRDCDDVEDPAQRRQFFTCNLNGMSIPGVGILPAENFHEWQMLLPEGSVLLVDEVQEVLRPDGGRVPPPHVTALEKHRHTGIDFIVTTQHPSFVHTHVRKLATNHQHVVPLTNTSAQIFEWREVNESPDFKRDSAKLTTWLYPSKLYGLYKSATRHTKKLKWPPWLRKLVLYACVGVPLVGYLIWKFATMGTAVASPEKGSPGAEAGKDTPVATAAAAPVRTASDYMAQYVPRVQSMPWSAPAYDGHKPQSEPDLYCVAIKTEDSEKCQCYTEQATRYEVEARTCRHIAEWGTYNPFRRPVNSQQQQQQQAGQQAPGQTGRMPVAALDEGSSSPPRVGSNYAPPTTLPWDADYFGGGKSGR